MNSKNLFKLLAIAILALTWGCSTFQPTQGDWGAASAPGWQDNGPSATERNAPDRSSGRRWRSAL